MLIHSVYFWLKPDLTPAERELFLGGLESLKAIKTIEQVYIGTPAAIPPRPVVDGSYSYNLCVLFKDVKAHDEYQVDPVHRAFVDTCKHLWVRVQIYDAA